MQDLFDASFIKNDLKSLRTNYQALRKLELSTPLDFNFENVYISSLAENIALACDIICNENGKSFIYCGNPTPLAKANQKLGLQVLLI